MSSAAIRRPRDAFPETARTESSSPRDPAGHTTARTIRIQTLVRNTSATGLEISRATFHAVSDDEMIDILAEAGLDQPDLSTRSTPCGAPTQCSPASSPSYSTPRSSGSEAKMRARIRRLLARYGYPLDQQEAAVELVIEQADLLAASWPAGSGRGRPKRPGASGPAARCTARARRCTCRPRDATGVARCCDRGTR